MAGARRDNPRAHLSRKAHSQRPFKFGQVDEDDIVNEDEIALFPQYDASAFSTTAEPRLPPPAPTELHTRPVAQPISSGGIGQDSVGSDAHRVTEVMMAESSARTGEPRSYHEAVNGAEGKQWRLATQSELDSMKRLNTFTVMALPPGRKAIPCMWVFKRKHDKNGAVSRFKARIVAKGFRQVHGRDYDATFAPVLLYTTWRLLMALVASLDLVLIQLDVPTAFLNATMDRELYMEAPPGLKVPFGFVCLVNKTIYGLKQSPRMWNEEFNAKIVALGYRACHADACLYVKTGASGGPILIGIFVDDMFAACSQADQPQMRADLDALKKLYNIEKEETGPEYVMLGMRVRRDLAAGTLTIDHEVYITQVLERHGLELLAPAPTPEVVRATLTPYQRHAAEHYYAKAGAPEHGESGIEAYGTFVGIALYVGLSTHPEVAHAASVLARDLRAPTHECFLAAKRLMRYLSGARTRGLVYHRAPDADTLAYLGPCFCDADWAGDTTDRRSTSGYVMKVNGCTISWSSKKQATVALSSAEAEYMAIAYATQEVGWLRTLLDEIGHSQPVPTVLLSDNLSAISIAHGETHHARTKHIDIRHHFIRERIATGEVQLHWVASAEQQADILTKALAKATFDPLVAQVFGETL